MNQRFETIRFTESVLEKLMKFYQFRMENDSKLILFKILHISIVIHSPQENYETESISNNEYDNMLRVYIADDSELWSKNLRCMLSIIEREIDGLRKQSNRLNSNTNVCEVFTRMAAKLCTGVCTEHSFSLCNIVFDVKWNILVVSDFLERMRLEFRY